MQAFSFDEHFSRCLEHLKSGKYTNATSELYPISKKTGTLEYASDGDVAQFARSISEVVVLLGEKLENNSGAEQFRFLVTDAFRILRNSCVTARVQDQLREAQGANLMVSTLSIAEALPTMFNGESLVQALAVVVQFLCNFSINNTNNQDLVWDHYKGTLKGWLDMPKEEEIAENKERVSKIMNFASGVVEACLPRQWQRMTRFLDDCQARNTVLSVIQAATMFRFEFRKKAMAKVVEIPDLVAKMFPILTHSERATVYDCLNSVVNDWRSQNEIESEMPQIVSNLKDLAESLILSRPGVHVCQLKNDLARGDTDLHNHVKMLEVLSSASCCKVYSEALGQMEVKRESGPKTLAEYAIDLLYEVHKEGEKEHNMLSMVQAKSQVICDHPAYLLRRDLVRLISNLAFYSKDVQDLVREFKGRRGLPVIIEQTAIDERNPFLAEWAKLALRNLLFNNEESVSFLSGLQSNSLERASEALRGMGLVMERDGPRIKIRQEGRQPTLTSMLERDVPRPL